MPIIETDRKKIVSIIWWIKLNSKEIERIKEIFVWHESAFEFEMMG